MKHTFWIIVCLLCLSTQGLMAQNKASEVKISSTMTEIDGVRFVVHSVARGEKIEDIAQAYNVKIKSIVEYNPQARGRLKFRSSLLIPLTEAEDTQAQDSLELDVIELDPTTLDSLMLDSLSRSVFEYGLVRPFDINEPLIVKLLLPLDIENYNTKKGFVEFYNGFLMGLEQLGAGVELEVISTNRTTQRIEELILDSCLYNANVIIGPVYEDEIAAIAPWAASQQIPVFSPLATSSNELNPYVVEIAPSTEFQWDGVRELVSQSDVNLIVIEHQTLQNNDAISAVESAMNPLVQKVVYENKFTDVKELEKPLSKSLPNIIFLPIDNEIAVEEILTRYSSLNAQGYYKIAFIGTAQWGRFNKINMELFYKLNVSYPSSYYYDRMTAPAAQLFSSYVTKYQMTPTLFSMRGYDVARLAVGTLLEANEELMYVLNRDTATPVQTPYNFELKSDTTKIQNTKWALVQYKPNFTVEVR